MRISDWSSDVCSSDLGLQLVYQPLYLCIVQKLTGQRFPGSHCRKVSKPDKRFNNCPQRRTVQLPDKTIDDCDHDTTVVSGAMKQSEWPMLLAISSCTYCCFERMNTADSRRIHAGLARGIPVLWFPPLLHENSQREVQHGMPPAQPSASQRQAPVRQTQHAEPYRQRA